MWVRILKLKFVGLAAVLVLIVGGTAWAVDDRPKLITPTDPEQSTTLAERLAERRGQDAPTLSVAAKTRLTERCGLAQAALTDLRAKDNTARDSRTKVYTDLAKQLSDAIDSLEHYNAGSSSLKTAEATFYKGINRYLTDSLQYRTAVDDLINMDCASDPTGFEVTLTDARDLRQQLATDAANIKAALPRLQLALESAKQELIRNQTNGEANQ